MKYRFVEKYIKISPKKLRFYLNHIKQMSPKTALSSLLHTNGRGPKILYKAIKSSFDSMLYNNKINEDSIKFKNIIVNQGPVLKRYRPGGRGVAKPYKRRSSHIIVEFTIDSEINNKLANKKNAKLIVKNDDKSKTKIKNGTKS